MNRERARVLVEQLEADVELLKEAVRDLRAALEDDAPDPPRRAKPQGRGALLQVVNLPQLSDMPAPVVGRERARRAIARLKPKRK